MTEKQCSRCGQDKVVLLNAPGDDSLLCLHCFGEIHSTLAQGKLHPTLAQVVADYLKNFFGIVGK